MKELRVAWPVLCRRAVSRSGPERGSDAIDLLVYVLWAGVLLALLRYV